MNKIVIEDVAGLGVADINLVYDQSIVNVLGVANSDFDTLVPNIDNVAGITRIGALQMTNPGLDGSVVLAELTLNAVGSIGECSALNLGIIELKTIPGSNLPATEFNGTFCIIDTATTTTTTAMGGGGGVATSFEARCWICGRVRLLVMV